MADINLSVVAPELTLVFFALGLMMADVFIGGDKPAGRAILPWLALAGVVVTGLVCWSLWDNPVTSFQGMAVLDHFSLGLNVVILVAAALTILLSAGYIEQINRQIGEYYALLLLCASGMMAMGAATDLMAIFIALEILSLALYILCTINRQSPRSSEAGMKYFLLGAFASAFFVYGAALVYGAAGSTQLDAIRTMLASGKGDMSLLWPGIALLFVGFGFKVSLVPFHMWTPDVYQGAPTPVTAFMSVGTKAAAFAAFARVLLIALPAQHDRWGMALAILAIITMTVANLSALRQMSLKRMLAYSSIAHAGYVLVGLAAGTPAAADAAMAYLFIYAFMNIGAFGVVMALEKANEGDALQNRAAGLGQRWPWLAFVLAVCLFSLSGMPPFGGFLGKLYVFKAAVEGGYAWLAVIGMLNSAIAAYYYLRVTVAMYFEKPGTESATARGNWGTLNLGLAIAVVFTILIGVVPGWWSGWFSAGITGLAGF